MCVLCVSGRGRERQSPRCMHEQRTTAEEFTMLTGEEEKEYSREKIRLRKRNRKKIKRERAGIRGRSNVEIAVEEEKVR